MAVSYWLRQMEVDNDKAAREAAEAELDAMIEEICEGGPLVIKTVVDAFFEGSRAPGNMLGKS